MTSGARINEIFMAFLFVMVLSAHPSIAGKGRPRSMLLRERASEDPLGMCRASGMGRGLPGRILTALLMAAGWFDRGSTTANLARPVPGSTVGICLAAPL